MIREPILSFVDCAHCTMPVWRHVGVAKKCPFEATNFEPLTATAEELYKIEHYKTLHDLSLVGRALVHAHIKAENARMLARAGLDAQRHAREAHILGLDT